MNKLINKVSNTLFNVEKVKNNSIPKHFFTAEKKSVKIDGQKVEVMMNKERTQYVAFQIGDQAYYVRDHAFFEGNSYVEVKKPSKATVESPEVEATA